MPKFSETLLLLVYIPPPHTPSQQISVKHATFNMKSEAGRRLTFEKWPVALIDKNNLALAGFYYTDQ